MIYYIQSFPKSQRPKIKKTPHNSEEFVLFKAGTLPLVLQS